MQIDLMALLAASGFLLAASAIAGMVFSIVGTSRGATRRLQRRLTASPGLAALAERKEQVSRVVAHGLSTIARLAAPAGDGETSQMRRQLVQAGFRSPQALPAYLASKVLLALAPVVLVLWANALRVTPIPWLGAWAVGGAAVGFMLPTLLLRERMRSRQATISRGLPDALDLMVTCVEAGLGLDAAVQRVAGEVQLAHRTLAEELNLTFLEVKAGVKRTDAFRRLADRTGVQDLKVLAATLNQTDLFGTSVAKALRIQAEGMRIRRMQKAEERAAILSVKMTVPLVVCFLPALMTVLIGPAWVNISAHFLKSVK